MPQVIKLTNTTDEELSIGGIDFPSTETITLTGVEHVEFRADEDVMMAVSEGKLMVSNASQDFTSPIDGWTYFLGDTMPRSSIEGNKISVHTSYKPDISGSTVYAVWSGAGDDMTDPINGNGTGPLLSLETVIDQPTATIDVEFNPIYGRVWLHEAYLKFTGAGNGDSISSTIVSYPVNLQQFVNKDLIVTDGWIAYSPQGPGTGTHGFADANISLIDRSFSGDGDWNYDSESGLTPNFTKTGNYKMSTEEQVVHRYVNNVPCYGDCATYFSMSSDETTELLKGYFVRVTLNNNSNTVWHTCILMELYREMTYSP